MGFYTTETERKGFPKRLVSFRKMKDLSQEELAGKIGETRNAIAKWETGQSSPSIMSLLSLAKHFNTTTDFLLKGVRTEQNDIYTATGLSGDAITTLGRFKEHDPSGILTAALSKALSSAAFLNVVASLMLLENSERGFYDGCSHTPSELFYQCKLSPDSYAAYLSSCLTLVIDAIRTGNDASLTPYPPAVRELQAETDKLRQEGDA